MMLAMIIVALLWATILIAGAFALGYYTGATSVPPTTIVEVEGGHE